MNITATNTYGGITVEQAYALVADPGFREEACAAQGATAYDVTVEPNAGGGHTVTLVRTMPTDMPDFIKSFVGDTVKVKQVEEWSGADADGRRRADVRISIVGQPVDGSGTAVLSEADGLATLLFTGEVKVAVPFLGKKIEPEVVRAITASLRHEAQLATSKLA